VVSEVDTQGCVAATGVLKSQTTAGVSLMEDKDRTADWTSSAHSNVELYDIVS